MITIKNLIINKFKYINIDGLDDNNSLEFAIYLSNTYIDNVKSLMKSKYKYKYIFSNYSKLDNFREMINSLRLILGLNSDEGKLLNDLVLVIKSNVVYITYEDSVLQSSIDHRLVSTNSIARIIEYGKDNLKGTRLFTNTWSEVVNNYNDLLDNWILYRTHNDVNEEVNTNNKSEINISKSSKFSKIVGGS